MPTLNKAKKETQTILKLGGISVAIIFLFLMGIRFLTFVKDMFAPPPPPQAIFGKLPPIFFPTQQKENIIYSLDTISGFLPGFPDRAKIYKININPATLLGLEKTREKVAKAGFTSNGVQVAEDTYQWVEQDQSLQRKITMNIFSSDFTLSSPYLIYPSLQTLNKAEEQNDAIEVSQSYLSGMSLFPKDIDEKKTKTAIYAIKNGTLMPTSKISDARIVRVDFYQKDIDKLPIYYEKGVTANIGFLVGKEKNALKVVEGRYSHKDISETSSTYAIKPASQAFEELKKGKGYIAYKDPDTVEVVIKKVFLGYYIGEDNQEFLIPVVVFEGSNNFVAYVSAVRDEWISN